MDRPLTYFDLETIKSFMLLDYLAKTHYNGHFTIMAFTTNYRVMFYTAQGIEYINSAYDGSTLKEAIDNCINENMKNDFPYPETDEEFVRMMKTNNLTIK